MLHKSRSGIINAYYHRRNPKVKGIAVNLMADSTTEYFTGELNKKYKWIK